MQCQTINHALQMLLARGKRHDLALMRTLIRIHNALVVAVAYDKTCKVPAQQAGPEEQAQGAKAIQDQKSMKPHSKIEKGWHSRNFMAEHSACQP